MFGFGKKRGHRRQNRAGRKGRASFDEPTSTQSQTDGICDYSAIDHVIESQPTQWHTASCLYVTTLFAFGILSIISIFRGGRRRSGAGRGSVRRKSSTKRTLAEHLSHGAGGKLHEGRQSLKSSDAASASSGKVSMLTDDNEFDRLVEEQMQTLSGASPTSADPLEELASRDVPLFPQEATEAEVARFVRARKGDLMAGAEQLRHYMEWHKENVALGSNTANDNKSESDWRSACRIAKIIEDTAQADTAVELPCVVFLDDDNDDAALRSLDGTRICHHLPARIDTNLASGQVYAQALGIYLDRRLSRDSEEKFDVFVDTRPGEGWGNISAYSLVPFIRHASKLLNDLHPERLHRAVVYPVPSVCAFIWNRLIKPWMDPVTADKIVLIGGPARVRSKLPKSMQKIASESTLKEMERRRLELFVES